MEKEPDIARFKIEYIPRTLSAKLQRKVLRKAWIGRLKCKVKDQAWMITEAYRRRLDELAPYWSWLSQHQARWFQLRNCCPTHIVPVLAHRTTYCRKRVLCPWCHARWVREIWETFERVMWPEGDQEKSIYSLIWVEPDRQTVSPDWPLQNAIATATAMFKTPPISDVVGHVAWATVIPWALSPELYRVSRFFLGLTENHEPLTTKLRQPTRAEAARLFGRFFQYPRQMVVTVPALVANVLDAQVGHRLFNRYGILRAARGS